MPNDPANNRWCFVCKAYTIPPPRWGNPCPDCDGANLDPNRIAYEMGYGRGKYQGD